MTASGSVTSLLSAWSQGDKAALHRLMPLVYAELRRIAARHVRHESPGHDLQPTLLVHEAYLRLVEQDRAHWQNRTQFFAVAARLMRRILVDQARARAALKRGGQQVSITVSDARSASPPRSLDVIALDRALARLSRIYPDQARLVELRYFGGLTIEETGDLLGISPASVKRQWTVARAWLLRELEASDP